MKRASKRIATEKSRKEIKYELERAFRRLLQTEALGDLKEIKKAKRRIRLYEDALFYQLKTTVLKKEKTLDKSNVELKIGVKNYED